MIPFVAALVRRTARAASAVPCWSPASWHCAAPIVRHLRPLFPPTVVGVVICMGGMALVNTATRNALGVQSGQWAVDGASALVAGVTLAAIVVLPVWGRRLRG